jgi:hypothetical protein
MIQRRKFVQIRKPGSKVEELKPEKEDYTWQPGEKILKEDLIVHKHAVVCRFSLVDEGSNEEEPNKKRTWHTGVAIPETTGLQSIKGVLSKEGKYYSRGELWVYSLVYILGCMQLPDDSDF